MKEEVITKTSSLNKSKTAFRTFIYSILFTDIFVEKTQLPVINLTNTNHFKIGYPLLTWSFVFFSVDKEKMSEFQSLYL